MSIADELRRKRKRTSFPWWIPVLCFLVVALGAMALWKNRDSLPRMVDTNRDHAAVDAYLRKSLFDGDYEVVKWYPAKDTDAGHIVRLRYYVQGSLGKVGHDECFVLDRGKVVHSFDASMTRIYDE